jgi:hypothetical protein
MATYHYFRSEQRPSLHGFTDDSAGAKLPREDGPWRLVRAVDPGEGWSGAVDRSAVETGVRMNGYYLFESDAALTFGQEDTSARDFS